MFDFSKIENVAFIGIGAAAIYTGYDEDGEHNYFFMALGALAIGKGLFPGDKNNDDDLGAGNNPLPPNNGGGGTSRPINQAKVNALVVRLHTELNTWAWVFDSGRCHALRDLNSMFDVDFIATHNLYYNQYGNTLGRALASLRTSGCQLGETVISEIQNRMAQLNIV